MNKFVSLLLPAIFMATIVCGQKVIVPEAVKAAFTKKFPNATNIKWGKEDAKEYEAEFKNNNISIAANFAADGS